MNTKEHSDLRACWGILWRSFVLMPYMLLIFVMVGGVWLSRWVLPVCALLWFYSHDWLMAGGALALWYLAAWSYRRFQLCRFFEPPPSLL